ncbi:uncharacterized protein LOC115212193 [Octopus sinensis]|uniref:Uncharacterized protein LOC115212193 n=1 Tax=Octopus sinensis TaxID=2607531 RepID=A0A6P7SG10_9MOLL|nr:uncharacterized protein LOC115212193 [Octopus sinensis]
MSTSFFLKPMPRDRLLTLLLHFNFGQNQDDRLHRIRPIVDKVTENVRTVCVSTQDESFFGNLRKGSDSNNTNRKKMPALESRIIKYASQLAGYTWNYKIYTGQKRLKLQEYTLASTDVKLSLDENLFDKGHNIYMDKWFSSPDVFLKLQARGINFCETVTTHGKKHAIRTSKDETSKGGISVTMH